MPFTTPDGQDVLSPAPAADAQMIEQFLSYGTPTTASVETGPTRVTSPLPAVLTAATSGNTGVTVTTVAGSLSGSRRRRLQHLARALEPDALRALVIRHPQ